MKYEMRNEVASVGQHQEWQNANADGWLSLAAAPTFAVMALLTEINDGGPLSVICSASPFGGMVAMYLLMSAFHLAPWLKLIANWRRGLSGPVSVR